MTMSKQFFFIGFAMLLAGCSTASASAALPGNPERGREIYETGGEVGVPCASCHSLDGTRIVGPSWEGLAERAPTRIEGISGVDYIRDSILNPSAYVVEGYDDLMPDSFGETLTHDEIDDVIAFLYSLDE